MTYQNSTTTKRAKRKRVALYLRVSTKRQTVENQRLVLEEVAERAGWEIVEVYEDNGVSGTKDSRPALDSMMADARRRRFNMIAVFALDRLGRSTQHLVNLSADLQSLGIDLYSHRQSIDTSTPTGKMFFTILTAVSEFERDLIVDRINAGLDRARAKGVRLGRRPGWRPEKRKGQDEILALHKAGVSVRKIAATVSVAPGTVQKVIAEHRRS